MNRYFGDRARGALLLLGTLVFSVHARAGVSLGLNLGATYRNSYTDEAHTYSRTFGFPIFGINIASGKRHFGLKTYFDYSSFKLDIPLTKTTLTSNVLAWTSYATYQTSDLYLGLGGGVGYENNAQGYNIGYGFFGLDTGVKVNKQFGIDLRVFTPVGSTYNFTNIWSVVSVSYVIAVEDD